MSIGQLQDVKTLWLAGKIMRAESDAGQLLVFLGRDVGSAVPIAPKLHQNNAGEKAA